MVGSFLSSGGIRKSGGQNCLFIHVVPLEFGTYSSVAHNHDSMAQPQNLFEFGGDDNDTHALLRLLRFFSANNLKPTPLMARIAQISSFRITDLLALQKSRRIEIDYRSAPPPSPKLWWTRPPFVF
jgi:hypothetical protein